MQGEDSWIGMRVCKDFWIGKGKNKKRLKFNGLVASVDDDEENNGHRLFEVRYDDGDIEWLPPEDIPDILVSADTVIR